MNTARRGRHVRTTGALVLFILGMGAIMAVGQQKSLPSVISASVPLYPRTPQVAHIEGVVRLLISTDGNRVVSVEVQSGQPMLAHAAQDNIKTWQFEQHSPTTFEATFQYRLLLSKCDAECYCASAEKPSVLLHLPTDVEVNAKELMVCDPASDRLKK
jgi:Gram-negative bacterial TonB protein C-terminal